MSERRAWWTDDLIEAVFRIMDDYAAKVRRGEWDPHGTPTFDVIAAVEDWARWEHVPKGTLLRLERAEAVIARVRELAHNALLGTDAGMGYPHVNAEDILRALDGAYSDAMDARVNEEHRDRGDWDD